MAEAEAVQDRTTDDRLLRLLCVAYLAVGAFLAFLGPIESAVGSLEETSFTIVSPDLTPPLVAAVLGAVTIVFTEDTPEDTFTDGLFHAWLGFSLGAAAAAAVAVASGASESPLLMVLPVLLLVLSGAFVGIPFGVITGILSTIFTYLRDRIVKRKGPVSKAPDAGAGNDPGYNPFGWHRRP